MADSAANRLSWQRYDLRVNRSIPGGYPGFGGGNEIAPGDTSAIAQYQFDSADLLVDSLGKQGDLIPSYSGSSTHTSDTNTYIEGDGGIRFYTPVVGEPGARVILLPAAQTANFPGTNTGDSFTICYWYRLNIIDVHQRLSNSVSTIDHLGASAGWRVGIQSDNDLIPNFYAQLTIRNPSLVWVNTSSALLLDRWYHIATTYDGATGDVRIRVFDVTADDVIGPDTTGNLGIMQGSARFVGVNPTNIGVYSDEGGEAIEFQEWRDDLIIFDRVLSVTEIDEIRTGTFES